MILTTLGAALNALTDNDPATVPDWNMVLPQLAAGIGLICARDNKKSTEQVRASPETS